MKITMIGHQGKNERPTTLCTLVKMLTTFCTLRPDYQFCYKRVFPPQGNDGYISLTQVRN